MFLLFAEINAQYNNIGAGIGIGSFMGNFPSQTVFGGKLY